MPLAWGNAGLGKESQKAHLPLETPDEEAF